jgi:hypothetical protein
MLRRRAREGNAIPTQIWNTQKHHNSTLSSCTDVYDHRMSSTCHLQLPTRSALGYLPAKAWTIQTMEGSTDLVVVSWQEQGETSHKEHIRKKAFRAQIIRALQQARSNCSAYHHGRHQSCKDHAAVHFSTICLPNKHAIRNGFKTPP